MQAENQPENLLCHPGRLILIQMLFEMNLYRDRIYSSFFLNNNKKRKLIGLSNIKFMFPFAQQCCTTFKKKNGIVFQMLARELCALLVFSLCNNKKNKKNKKQVVAKPRCCTNFNSSDNRKVFHLATVHFETALAFVDCTADCIRSDFWECSWGHTVTESFPFLMQCSLRSQRSQTSNTDFQPCPLPAEISPDSLIL